MLQLSPSPRANILAFAAILVIIAAVGAIVIAGHEKSLRSGPRVLGVAPEGDEIYVGVDDRLYRVEPGGSPISSATLEALRISQVRDLHDVVVHDSLASDKARVQRSLKSLIVDTLVAGAHGPVDQAHIRFAIVLRPGLWFRMLVLGHFHPTSFGVECHDVSLCPLQIPEFFPVGERLYLLETHDVDVGLPGNLKIGD